MGRCPQKRSPTLDCTVPSSMVLVGCPPAPAAPITSPQRGLSSRADRYIHARRARVRSRAHARPGRSASSSRLADHVRAARGPLQTHSRARIPVSSRPGRSGRSGVCEMCSTDHSRVPHYTYSCGACFEGQLFSTLRPKVCWNPTQG